MAQVSVTHLSKAYRQYPNRWLRLLEWFLPMSKSKHSLKWILRDINFHLSSGDAVGIVGVNGAGKSTLLKLITGTTQPTVGSVKIEGRVAALLELGMGFHQDFTGRQNALMSGQLLGLRPLEIERLMPEIEDFAEIGDYIDQPVRVYSSGMQVRLAFAVATALRPDILIIDEALSVGDAYFQHKSFSKIRSFQELGTTLLFVSHDLATIRSLCPKVIWLENGTVREFGETKEVLDAYATAIYAKNQDIVGVEKRSLEESGVKKEITQQKRDSRLSFINNSNLRNDIQIFEFNKDAIGWGDGGAKITDTTLFDTDGVPLSWIIGGEEVVLAIEAIAMQDLSNVLVGFMVRNKLGQNLFGDNTYLTTINEPINIGKNTVFKTTFRFLMPLMPQGSYAITSGITTGTQLDHVVHEWIHEALFFESHNGYSVNGLIGVPMYDIQIKELQSNF